MIPETARDVEVLDGHFVYEWPKPSVTASAVVWCLESDEFAMVKRKFDPDKGKLCFPGGFLNVYREDLPTCARREVFEEVGLKNILGPPILLDVRSKPDRDISRGHVIDTGWLLVISEDEKCLAKPGDDAEEVFWIPCSDLESELYDEEGDPRDKSDMELDWSFDHPDMAREFLKKREEMLRERSVEWT